MKKGHRRTHSETITISKPLLQNHQKKVRQQYTNPINSYHQIQHINQTPIQYTSIQNLLQKSENNITQRVLYIENLQQPNISTNNTQNFSFGKGVNYKLNNFKLNMGQIPEVPKSNESTSLQGQNKLQKLQKDLYFIHEPGLQNLYGHVNVNPTINHVNHPNYLHKNQKEISKYSLVPNIKRTKTASTVHLKHINKSDKIEKLQKNQYKNTGLLNTIKQNPLKRTKIQYQTHKKNVHSFGNGIGIGVGSRLYKESIFDPVDSNKKKKKNYVV